MMHSEVRPAALEVLELKDEDIGEFMRRMIATKRLTPLVQTLNNDILDGSTELADAALRAFARMGFVDEAA